MPEIGRTKWLREAVLVAASMFFFSAVRFGPLGWDEAPFADRWWNVVILGLSIAGLAGVGATVLGRKWGFFVALASAIGLGASYGRCGAGWAVVALFLLTALFLAVEVGRFWTEMR